MNKEISLILILIYILTVSQCLAKVDMQRNVCLQGIYYSVEDSLKIEIKADYLYIMTHHDALILKDTLAICDYIIVNKCFLKISNLNIPYYNPFANAKIDSVKDDNSDSTAIMFDIPNVTIPLSIQINTYSCNHSFPHTYKFTYTPGDDSKTNMLTVCPPCNKMSLLIRPADINMLKFTNAYGYFNGRLSVSSLDCKSIDLFNIYDSTTNNDIYGKILIQIPQLTDDMFTTLYIPEDFIQVDGNCLKWRNMKFIKVE